MIMLKGRTEAEMRERGYVPIPRFEDDGVRQTWKVTQLLAMRFPTFGLEQTWETDVWYHEALLAVFEDMKLPESVARAVFDAAALVDDPLATALDLISHYGLAGEEGLLALLPPEQLAAFKRTDMGKKRR